MKKNLPPPKRDFQEANPPKNLTEFYARYDPSIGAGIAIALGSLLLYLLAQVAVKFVCKNIKKQLRKTKTFGKYFPEEKLPPLHVVRKMVAEQGLEVPDAILIKLSCDGRELLMTEANQANLLANSTMDSKASSPKLPPSKLPKDFFNDQENKFSVPPYQQEYYGCPKSQLDCLYSAAGGGGYNAVGSQQQKGVITVNIIGATPAITPRSIVDDFESSNSFVHFPAATVLSTSNCHSNSDSRLVTTATIEKLPLMSEYQTSRHTVLSRQNTVPRCDVHQSKITSIPNASKGYVQKHCVDRDTRTNRSENTAL